jgi:hypothetical protein
VLLDDLFRPERKADKYLRAADERGGAASILTGIAANHSFRTVSPVRIADLVPGLRSPDYTAMPKLEDRLPMPPGGR